MPSYKTGKPIAVGLILLVGGSLVLTVLPVPLAGQLSAGETSMSDQPSAEPSANRTEPRRMINFDFDRSIIRPEYKPVLDSIAEELTENQGNLLIEGHCDELGSDIYNLVLGDARAEAARDYLLTKGVAWNRMRLVSYGEARPLCNEATEDCWALNRRAEFQFVLNDNGSE